MECDNNNNNNNNNNNKKRGIRVRFVTTVNEGSIASCKQLMKVGEIFQNGGVKGNIVI